MVDIFELHVEIIDPLLTLMPVGAYQEALNRFTLLINADSLEDALHHGAWLYKPATGYKLIEVGQPGKMLTTKK